MLQSPAQEDSSLHIFPVEFKNDLLSKNNLTAACLSNQTVYSLKPIGIVRSFPLSLTAQSWRVGLYIPPSNLYDAAGIHAESVKLRLNIREFVNI